MSKCCGCGVEISDKEKEKIIEDFCSEITETLNKFNQIPDAVIVAYLICVAKDIMCSKRLSYTLTIGMLQEFLTDGLRELWESRFNEEDEEEKECNQPPVLTAE